AVALSALLQLAGVLLPPLRTLLGTGALSAVDLVACAVAATVPALAIRLTATGGKGKDRWLKWS
ncbi:hypothetical protein ABNF97_33635, partial [Plantactinospora sp. B6F1]|uniref:hypothetical protein n=1 Tax=Plantactinospora sp. B6F1 TaxID=3158971 RepID=UPI0032D93B48